MMPAELNHDKLKTAFLAGRMDALAQAGGFIPDGIEHLFRVILGETDVQALRAFSKVLFQPAHSPVAPPPSAPTATATTPALEAELKTLLREGGKDALTR